MKKFCLTFVLIMSMLSCFGFAIANDTIASTETTSVSSDTTTSDATEGTSATLDLSTLIAKLPCLNQAILYSWESNSVKYAMSFTVISLFNDKINLDAMYVPSSEIGALASFKLFNLGEWIKFPLLEYIEFQPFVYAGMKNIGSGSDLLSSDLDYGVGAKIISIKF
jgi:hypothetical protein